MVRLYILHHADHTSAPTTGPHIEHKPQTCITAPLGGFALHAYVADCTIACVRVCLCNRRQLLSEAYAAKSPELAAFVLSSMQRYISWIDIGLVANDK